MSMEPGAMTDDEASQEMAAIVRDAEEQTRRLAVRICELFNRLDNRQRVAFVRALPQDLRFAMLHLVRLDEQTRRELLEEFEAAGLGPELGPGEWD